jgi:hypothetical protein
MEVNHPLGKPSARVAAKRFNEVEDAGRVNSRPQVGLAFLQKEKGVAPLFFAGEVTCEPKYRHSVFDGSR